MSDDPRQWLSTGAEALAALPVGEGRSWDCDVLIVGSGYGGAVAGAAMAGATRKEDGQPARIWILERGLERAPGRFPGRFRDLAGEVRFGLQDGHAARGNAEGLFDLRIGGDMSVLLGNGLGGGSLINSGVMQVPEEKVFAAGWPADVTTESLAPHYQAMQTALGAARLPENVNLGKLSLLDTLGPTPGQSAERCPVTVNFGPKLRTADGVIVPSCTMCGDCLTGCNVGAKRSLDTSCLVEARRHGAQIFCGGFVERLKRLEQDGESGWEVVWHLTEPVRRGGERRLRVRNVVLAAGALGSTEILMRSRDADAGLSLSPMLGRGFSGNGDAIIGARGHAKQVHAVGVESMDPRTQNRQVGPTIVGAQRFPAAEGRPSFVLEDFAVPAALRSVFGEISALLEKLARGETATGAGTDPFAVTDFSIERTSLMGQITEDAVQGKLKLWRRRPNDQPALEGGIRIVSPKWKRDAAAESVLAAVPFATGVVGLVPASFTDPDTGQLLLSRLPISTHPLGGCRMSDDVGRGVVNSNGEVFLCGSKDVVGGLAVLDGAIVPKALGTNPALTISALASRAAPALMVNWGLNGRGQAAAAPLRSARPFVPLLIGPQTPPGWRIRERQVGQATGSACEGMAMALNIEFEPIPSFRGLLAQPAPPKVGVRYAELMLDNARHRLEGAVTFFVRPQQAGLAADGATPVAFTIDYDLKVVSADIAPPQGLEVGTAVRGTKYFTLDLSDNPWKPGPVDGVGRYLRSPWRELSEIELAIGGAFAGRLKLDLGDLVDQGEALLRAESVPSMPDVLDDLAAIGLYIGRHLTNWLMSGLSTSLLLRQQTSVCDPVQRAASRLPGIVGNITPERVPLARGAGLSVYRPSDTKVDACPVLLIHGLAMSGNSYTHSALGGGLAGALLAERREVWVLDLRSSIANESQRQNHAAADWTVEAISQDIPNAIACMAAKRGADLRMDVVAHCFGGVMFCMAALANGRTMARHIRSVVLSQVGPMVTLSPLNRLRGFLAAYLWRHGQIDEFDCLPGKGLSAALVDAFCASFPYLDTDDACSIDRPTAYADLIRRRADWIFGQMYTSDKACPAIQPVLGQLLGWVKAPLLAQALQFARMELLTDASGRNKLLRRRNFSEGFSFPVLLIHGSENRVFDVQGGKRSVQLLHELRGLHGDPTKSPCDATAGQTWYGRGTSAQLVVLEDYGHLDVLVRKDARTRVFPLITDFLKQADSRDAAGGRLPVPGLDWRNLTQAPQIELPWIGPMLGLLRDVAVPQGAQSASQEGRLNVRLMVQASMRRAAVETIAIVPIRERNGKLEPLCDRAVQLKRSRATRRLLSLSIDAATLRTEGISRFAVVTVHRDLPLSSDYPPGPKQWLSERLNLRIDELEAFERDLRGDPPSAAQLEKTKWLVDSGRRPRRSADDRGLAAWPSNQQALALFFKGPPKDWLQACFSLTPQAVAGRRRPWHTRFEQPLSFALASCQYPPGPLDKGPAMASYKALLALVESGAGPQFVILAGDQVYVDATAGVFDPAAVPERSDPREAAAQKVDLSGIYERAWRLSEVRRLMARLPSVAMIDDHEVRNDYPGRLAAIAAGVRDRVSEVDETAAVQHQVRLSGGLALGSDRSGSYAWNSGGLPFFMLETRRWRQPRTPANVATARMLNSDVDDDEQVLVDLLKRLTQLPAHLPKFILSSTPLLPPERFPTDAGSEAMRLRSDSWSGFPASAIFLMNGILKANIRGVVLLAGDPHQSSVTRFCFGDDSGLEVVSVVSSGLYTPWPFANQRPDEVVFEGPVRIGGTGPAGCMRLQLYTSQPGFAAIDVSPATLSRPAGLRVSLHGPADQPPLVTELTVGLPKRDARFPFPTHEQSTMPEQPEQPEQPEPLTNGAFEAVAMTEPTATSMLMATALSVEGAAALPLPSQMKATAKLWLLTNLVDIPPRSTPVEATLQGVEAGSWQIDKPSFHVDSIALPDGFGKIEISLRQSATLLLQGTRLKATFPLQISVTDEKKSYGLTATLALSNEADDIVTKWDILGGETKITLKVAAYDTGTGNFAIAGHGRLAGRLTWPIALRIEGCFDPPL